jgi:uncharacterized protein (DUF1919 family)
LIKDTFLKMGNRISNIWVSVRWKVGNKLLPRYRRMKLRNTDFSIICNNCLAGGIYQKLGLEYNTPTIGLFFCSDDYIRFLQKFEYYIKQPLMFKATSRHPKANEALKKGHYPVGVLGGDIEIHFLHYADEKEAEEKWNRRRERINFENLFFIYSDQEENFCEEFLQIYEKLPFKRKIFFSSKPRANNRSVVFIGEYKDDPTISKMLAAYEKYFDVTKWLNGDEGFVKQRSGSAVQSGSRYKGW